MAIRDLESFQQVFSELNDDLSPERVTQLAEDVADTLRDMSTKLGNAAAEKERLDREWRQKYTSRFFEGTPVGARDTREGEETASAEDISLDISFDDLFK